MAHREQLEMITTISRALPRHFSRCKVLEVGSLDLNGSIRPNFLECEYLGIDVGEGRGVDLVCQGQDYAGPSDHFDTVISCEAMEHNPFWKETLLNMIRVCRPGGLIVMTCATVGREEHGTARTTPEDSPLTVASGWDYYRNLSERDISSAVELSSHLAKWRFWVNWSHFDLLFCGVKRGGSSCQEDETGWQRMCAAIAESVGNSNHTRGSRLRKIAALILGDSLMPYARLIWRGWRRR